VFPSVTGRTAVFPSVTEYLKEWNQIGISRFDVIKPIPAEDLENLLTVFDRYVPDRSLASQLLGQKSVSGEVCQLVISEDVAELQNELIDLHHDEFHRQLLSMSLGEF